MLNRMLAFYPVVCRFEVIEAVKGFTRLSVERGLRGMVRSLKSGKSPVQIVDEDKVFIHKRVAL